MLVLFHWPVMHVNAFHKRTAGLIQKPIHQDDRESTLITTELNVAQEKIFLVMT